MNNILAQVRDFADRSHGEQTRKYSPDRYIVHPTRVMEICQSYTNDIAILSAALLHDVLEDTPVTKEEMETFLKTVMDERQSLRTLRLVVELTDIYTKQNYPQWNRRKRKAERLEKTSPDSQTIKYADIIDNSKEIAEHDPEFAEKFLQECSALLKKMTKGNPPLRERAIGAVTGELQKLKGE